MAILLQPSCNYCKLLAPCAVFCFDCFAVQANLITLNLIVCCPWQWSLWIECHNSSSFQCQKLTPKFSVSNGPDFIVQFYFSARNWLGSGVGNCPDFVWFLCSKQFWLHCEKLPQYLCQKIILRNCANFSVRNCSGFILRKYQMLRQFQLH